MTILIKPKNIVHKCHLWQIPCLSGSDKICCLLYPVTLDWVGGAPSTMVGDDNRGWAPLGGCGFIQIWESTSYIGRCQEKLRFRVFARNLLFELFIISLPLTLWCKIWVYPMQLYGVLKITQSIGKPLFEMCCFHMGISRKGGWCKGCKNVFFLAFFS